MTVQFLPTTTTTPDDDNDDDSNNNTDDDDDDVHAECETKCNYALTFQNKNCRFHFVLSEKNLYLSQLLLLSFLSEPFSDVGQTSFEDSIDRVCDGFSSFEFQRCGCCTAALLRASPFSATASLGFVHTGSSSDAPRDVRQKSSASRIERVTAVRTKN